MKEDDILPFVRVLQQVRNESGWTQEEMAKELGISRKTYVLMESCRWLPSTRERSHFVKALHGIHPSAAKAYVDLLGDRLEDYVEVKPIVQAAPSPALEPAHAKLVFDSALLGVAEELDVSPRTLRPLFSSMLARLASAGMPMAQAAELAKGALPAPLSAKRETT